MSCYEPVTSWHAIHFNINSVIIGISWIILFYQHIIISTSFSARHYQHIILGTSSSEFFIGTAISELHNRNIIIGISSFFHHYRHIKTSSSAHHHRTPLSAHHYRHTIIGTPLCEVHCEFTRTCYQLVYNTHNLNWLTQRWPRVS